MGKKWLKNLGLTNPFGFDSGDDSSNTNLAPRDEYEEEDDFLNPFGRSTRHDPTRQSRQKCQPSTKSAGSSSSTNCNSGDTTSVCGNLTGLWHDEDYDDCLGGGIGSGGGGAYDDVNLRDDSTLCAYNTWRYNRRRRRNMCLLVSTVLAIAGSAGFVALVAMQKKGAATPFSVSTGSEGNIGADAKQQAEEETHLSTTVSSPLQSSSTQRPSASPTSNVASVIQTTNDETDKDSCPAGFARFSLDITTHDEINPRSELKGTIKIQTLRAVDVMREGDRYEVAFQGRMADLAIKQGQDESAKQEFCLRTYKCYSVIVESDTGVAVSDAPHGNMEEMTWELRAYTHLGEQTDPIAYGGTDSRCTFAVTNSYELPGGGCPLTCATGSPTSSPTSFIPRKPSEVNDEKSKVADGMTYVPGELTVSKEGLLLSTGLDVRIIARSGEPVQYMNRNATSDELFHDRPDAAGVFAIPESHKHLGGGWIYTSNSEVGDEKGGVGSIFFDQEGNVVKYRRVLEGTSKNCGGGKTEWGTWISCEEKDGTRDGAIFEVDPLGRSLGKKTVLGEGSFESFASDVRDRDSPRFFVTEDYRDGALRRFTPSIANWTNPEEILHSLGTMEYLLLQPLNDSVADQGTYAWTTNFNVGKRNAELYFRNTEGISVIDNILYFVSKKQHDLFELDLDNFTWKKSSTKSGLFGGSPDQLVGIIGDEELVYFTEEGLGDESQGDSAAGVHARDNQGRFFTILESHVYHEESTGLAFSPDHRHLYVACELQIT